MEFNQRLDWNLVHTQGGKLDVRLDEVNFS